MATQKPIISVVLDEETLGRVDNFLFTNRMRSRSKAIGELVKLALDEWEKLEAEHGEAADNFDPLEKLELLMKDMAEFKEYMEKKKDGN